MENDPFKIRQQFGILEKQIQGKPLIYLDNAATTQKPKFVLDQLQQFYEEHNANINRGMHALTEEATVAYEKARKIAAHYIGAAHAQEIIFTRNTTEAINLVARSFGDSMLKEDDTVLLSIAEHHSNIIPWLQLKDRKKINIEWITLQPDCRIDLDVFEKILEKGMTKLVSITGLSNVLGTRTPLQKMIEKAHQYGAVVLVDAAQMIAHQEIDVQKLDIDFLAFSGHKIYGPTGIGVLYGKERLLEAMPPFLGGGDMIATVDTQSFTSAELPRKFEAGTPSIADAIGLGNALFWTESVGVEAMHERTKNLIDYARNILIKVPNITLLGPANGPDLLGCVSFVIEGIHPHDLTEILGAEGICLRGGHHCTMPLHKYVNIVASTRLSVAAYNTEEEIDRCIEAIERAQKILRK